MGEHRKRYPELPDGHFSVVDTRGRVTHWWVQGGRLRDFPLSARWRPLPPPAPAGLRGEDRERWREQWYRSTYWPFKDHIASEISADPLAAARRFRDRFAAGELPPDPPPRPRRRRPSWSRPRRASPADQRRAVEALAAHALAQAGMSVRQIAGTLEMPRMNAWRRVRQAESATGVAVARAALLQRADQLQASLLAESVMVPEHREQLAEWIGDLRQVVADLTRRP
jgi:hypothetical protein